MRQRLAVVRVPSSSWPALTSTVCAVFQVLAVNVRLPPLTTVRSVPVAPPTDHRHLAAGLRRQLHRVGCAAAFGHSERGRGQHDAGGVVVGHRHRQVLGHRTVVGARCRMRQRLAVVRVPSSSWPALTSTVCAVFQVLVGERQAAAVDHRQVGAGRCRPPSPSPGRWAPSPTPPCSSALLALGHSERGRGTSTIPAVVVVGHRHRQAPWSPKRSPRRIPCALSVALSSEPSSSWPALTSTVCAVFQVA